MIRGELVVLKFGFECRSWLFSIGFDLRMCWFLWFVWYEVCLLFFVGSCGLLVCLMFCLKVLRGSYIPVIFGVGV